MIQIFKLKRMIPDIEETLAQSCSYRLMKKISVNQSFFRVLKYLCRIMLYYFSEHPYMGWGHRRCSRVEIFLRIKLRLGSIIQKEVGNVVHYTPLVSNE